MGGVGDDDEDRKLASVIPIRGRRPSEDHRIRELSREARQTDELLEALARRAERALAEGRLKHALADCHRAVATKRAGPGVFWLLARIQLGLGDIGAAIAAAERAVTLAPLVGELWAALARVHDEAGNRAIAVESATRGVELDAEAPEPWAVLAELGEDIDGPIGDATRAWYWEQALDRGPARPRWISGWARAAVHAGEREEAVRRVEEAYAVDPSDLRVSLDRAYVLAHGLDAPERAIEAYEPLLPLRSGLRFEDRAELADTLYSLHRRAGEPRKALALLSEVANEQPSARRMLDLAYAALESGAHHESLFAAVTASATAPREPSILRGAGDVLSQLGAWLAAEQILTRYLKLVPDDADALMQRGRVREHRRSPKRARADYDRAVEVAEDVNERLRALSARASHRLRRGDVEGALDDHDRRVRIDKKGGWSRLQRGELWLELFHDGAGASALAAARRDFEAAARAGNADAFGLRALAREAGSRPDYELSSRDLERAAEGGIGVRNWWQELASLHAAHGQEARAADARRRAEGARWAIEIADHARRSVRFHS